MGGGCELAVLSDFIVASETAVFAVPEVDARHLPGHRRHPAPAPHHRRAARQGDDLHRAPGERAARRKAIGPRESPRADGAGAGQGARDRGDHRRQRAHRGAPGEEGRSPGAARPISRRRWSLAIEAYNNDRHDRGPPGGRARVQREAQARSSRAAGEGLDGPLKAMSRRSKRQRRDHEDMTFTLTEEQRALKAAVYEICKQYPRRVLARARRQARVSRGLRQ